MLVFLFLFIIIVFKTNISCEDWKLKIGKGSDLCSYYGISMANEPKTMAFYDLEYGIDLTFS